MDDCVFHYFGKEKKLTVQECYATNSAKGTKKNGASDRTSFGQFWIREALMDGGTRAIAAPTKQNRVTILRVILRGFAFGRDLSLPYN